MKYCVKTFFIGKTRQLLLILSFIAVVQTAQADTNLRISADTLQNQLGQWILLDARPAEAYQAGHLPGALNFPVSDTYAHQKHNGKIIEPVQMQQRLRALGVDATSAVVVYDDGQMLDAARLFWTLEVYGLNKVKVLNQGFGGWQKVPRPVSQDLPQVQPSNYVTNINSKRLATRFTTLLATQNPNQVIVDARPLEAYLGKVSSAKRYGHILKAINIPASHNLSQDLDVFSLQSLDTLKDLYKDIPKNNKVILYCAIGRISATNYLALRELGYDVANYDASWKEWGNDFALPITTPIQH
ncbi:MAG: sulfurtransferase [Thiotrichales bacterium]|nr:sulfurtransferase [Thiotrichales bacterium]